LDDRKKRQDAAGDTVPIRADEQLDAAKLEAYLRPRLPGVDGPMSLAQFPGGHSNLTYCVRFGSAEFVLRRPPLGPVAPRAHDMSREFRVLTALADVFPPAPRATLYCDDPAPLGSAFFVMERRRGVVVRGAWPEVWPDTPTARGRAARALLDALIALHDVDYVACGLGGLGHPVGFAERQVRGWTARWERAKTREIPALDRLARRLLETLPESPRPALIHNDFKFDNVMFDATDPAQLVAVFDWEMSTLGDPLIDLGIFLSYWPEAGDPPLRRGSPAPLTAQPGFPTRDELVRRYARARGVDTTRVGWYETFGLFKTAVVLEQIYVRFVRGQTRDSRFAEFEKRVPALAAVAELAAERSGVL
jgi:aminoglycoside phosphotransferase (APT) family kinase protein